MRQPVLKSKELNKCNIPKKSKSIREKHLCTISNTANNIDLKVSLKEDNINKTTNIEDKSSICTKTKKMSAVITNNNYSNNINQQAKKFNKLYNSSNIKNSNKFKNDCNYKKCFELNKNNDNSNAIKETITSEIIKESNKIICNNNNNNNNYSNIDNKLVLNNNTSIKDIDNNEKKKNTLKCCSNIESKEINRNNIKVYKNKTNIINPFFKFNSNIINKQKIKDEKYKHISTCNYHSNNFNMSLTKNQVSNKQTNKSLKCNSLNSSIRKENSINSKKSIKSNFTNKNLKQLKKPSNIIKNYEDLKKISYNKGKLTNKINNNGNFPVLNYKNKSNNFNISNYESKDILNNTHYLNNKNDKLFSQTKNNLNLKDKNELLDLSFNIKSKEIKSNLTLSNSNKNYQNKRKFNTEKKDDFNCSSDFLISNTKSNIVDNNKHNTKDDECVNNEEVTFGKTDKNYVVDNSSLNNNKKNIINQNNIINTHQNATTIINIYSSSINEQSKNNVTSSITKNNKTTANINNNNIEYSIEASQNNIESSNNNELFNINNLKQNSSINDLKNIKYKEEDKTNNSIENKAIINNNLIDKDSLYLNNKNLLYLDNYNNNNIEINKRNKNNYNSKSLIINNNSVVSTLNNNDCNNNFLTNSLNGEIEDYYTYRLFDKDTLVDIKNINKLGISKKTTPILSNNNNSSSNCFYLSNKISYIDINNRNNIFNTQESKIVKDKTISSSSINCLNSNILSNDNNKDNLLDNYDFINNKHETKKDINSLKLNLLNNNLSNCNINNQINLNDLGSTRTTNSTYKKNSNIINIDDIKLFKPKKISKIHQVTKSGISITNNFHNNYNANFNKVNQDTYFIFEDFEGKQENLYLGICDGHGVIGHVISNMISRDLPKLLNKNIINKKKEIFLNDANNIEANINNSMNYSINNSINSSLTEISTNVKAKFKNNFKQKSNNTKKKIDILNNLTINKKSSNILNNNKILMTKKTKTSINTNFNIKSNQNNNKNILNNKTHKINNALLELKSSKKSNYYNITKETYYNYNDINLTSLEYNNLIEDSFKTVNFNILETLKDESNLSGSTCVSLIYNPEKLITANVGDSRCVLGKYSNGSMYNNLINNILFII